MIQDLAVVLGSTFVGLLIAFAILIAFDFLAARRAQNWQKRLEFERDLIGRDVAPHIIRDNEPTVRRNRNVYPVEGGNQPISKGDWAFRND